MPNTLVQSLYDRIRVAELELERARRECSHPKHRIGWLMQRPGSLKAVRLCEECDSPVGEPSVEELAEFEERDALAKSQAKPRIGGRWRLLTNPISG